MRKRCEETPWQYWDSGECKTNPYLECEANILKDWNYSANACEDNIIEVCEAQEDMVWIDVNGCVFDDEKQEQRLKEECLSDKSKYWNEKECVSANILSAGN